MTHYRIWRSRHRARLLSRYTPDADIAALYWVGREKYTVGLFRDGREIKVKVASLREAPMSDMGHSPAGLPGPEAAHVSAVYQGSRAGESGERAIEDLLAALERDWQLASRLLKILARADRRARILNDRPL